MKKVISGISIEIDPKDWETISNLHPHRIFFIKTKTNKLYPMIYYNKKPLSLVRFILGITDKKMAIKFNDGNNLNLKRCNLETVTRKIINRAKTKSSSKKSSNYLGVSFCNRNKKWRAQIKIHKSTNAHIGYFNIEEDAAEAYNKYAVIHFGKMASLNKVERQNKVMNG